MNKSTQKMCAAALLCAVGILVPIISPIKIPVGAMSFTLASHVALFLAMFISPLVAFFVTIGTTLGFFLSGFPLVVVARAASQIVFVMIGAYLLYHYGDKFKKVSWLVIFAIFTGLIHGLLEMLVVYLFTFLGVPLKGDTLGYLFGLVGIGTFIHSILDFMIALIIWVPCSKLVRFPIAFKPAEKHKT